jgi:hypothetical protein
VGALLLAASIASAASGASAAAGVLATGLPDHSLTPGVRNPAVTQATIHRTICVPGWTRTVRPSSYYTTVLKRQQLATYGFKDRLVADYEEDHLISLELGGAPRDPRNLWPEPFHIRTQGTDLGAYAKDRLETYLKGRVCAGTMTLARAQYEIRTNWVAYWRIAFGRPAASTNTPGPTGAPRSALPASVQSARNAGATAVCNDGTWSYSASRSGTCSHHGGVYWWTGNLGPAGAG